MGCDHSNYDPYFEVCSDCGIRTETNYHVTGEGVDEWWGGEHEAYMHYKELVEERGDTTAQLWIDVSDKATEVTIEKKLLEQGS